MNKSIMEQFADFKTRHSLSNQDITKMITEYSNTELDLARSYFSEQYKISKSVFYKARDFAVIFCLIDEETCKKLKRKTIANYKRNNPKQTTNGPVLHFAELCVQRQKLLDTFSDNEIKDIAYKYEEGISLKNIAFAYEIGEYGIKMLLKKGLVLLIVDGDTTRAISKRLGSKLDNILTLRENNKQKVLDCVRKEIELLNLQIENYDIYYRNEKEKPSKEVLQKRLEELVKKEKEILRY